MKGKKITLAAFCCTLLLGGCSRRLFDVTMISSKNVPIGQEISLKQADQRVAGVDSKGVILCFALGIPDVKEAVDDAIEKYPGAVALSNAVVKAKWWHAFVYGKNKYIVEGNPVYLDKNAPVDQAVQQVTGASQPANALQIVHEVKDNETIATIAATYNVSVRDVVAWNHLTSSNLTAGMRLVIYMK